MSDESVLPGTWTAVPAVPAPASVTSSVSSPVSRVASLSRSAAPIRNTERVVMEPTTGGKSADFESSPAPQPPGGANVPIRAGVELGGATLRVGSGGGEVLNVIATTTLRFGSAAVREGGALP